MESYWRTSLDLFEVTSITQHITQYRQKQRFFGNSFLPVPFPLEILQTHIIHKALEWMFQEGTCVLSTCGSAWHGRCWVFEPRTGTSRLSTSSLSSGTSKSIPDASRHSSIQSLENYLGDFFFSLLNMSQRLLPCLKSFSGLHFKYNLHSWSWQAGSGPSRPLNTC